MIVGLLWMIYDLINAPEVDENENLISTDTDVSEEQNSYSETSVETKKESGKVSEVE